MLSLVLSTHLIVVTLMYMVQVSVEGFQVPKRMPRMAALSDGLVRERIAVYMPWE